MPRCRLSGMTKVAARGPDSLAEALARYERHGFRGQFLVRAPNLVECLACRVRQPPGSFRLVALHRLEGDTDPSDEVVVAALECGACLAKGTLVLAFGPEASLEDQLALKGFEDRRGADATLPPGL